MALAGGAGPPSALVGAEGAGRRAGWAWLGLFGVSAWRPLPPPVDFGDSVKDLPLSWHP